MLGFSLLVTLICIKTILPLLFLEISSLVLFLFVKSMRLRNVLLVCRERKRAPFLNESTAGATLMAT